VTTRRKLLALLLITALLLPLFGCAGVSVEELYSLPRFSQEYLQLQRLIDKEIAAGCEYYAPTAGSYRQSVQLWDLNGDGSQEALAFFRTPEQTLKICVYHAEEGGDYRQVETINGEGLAIRGLEYADMNGDGCTELLVSWQISAELRLLKAYAFTAWSGAVLLTADCTEFLVADMDGDGGSELLTLRMDSAGEGLVSCYKLLADNETETSSLYATEVFVLRGGQLRNITLSQISGVTTLLRAYSVFSTDINNDRCLEIPLAHRLYSQSELSISYWLLDWYSLDSAGKLTRALSTYHCYADGWYFILTDAMRLSLTVRRADSDAGERAVVLSTADPLTGQVTDLLTIYTLTGENRRDRARMAGRFALWEDNSTIFAASILDESLTEETVRANFKIIYTEWMTGAV